MEKKQEHVALLFIEKLHARYLFPTPYNDAKDIKKNLVNTFALGKCTKALSTWRGNVRDMLDKGVGFAEIHAQWPSISEEDLELFKEKEELASKKEQREWWKKLRQKNIGPHNLEIHG